MTVAEIIMLKRMCGVDSENRIRDEFVKDSITILLVDQM